MEFYFDLASIVEFSEDAIIGMTLDGIICSWNAAAERLYAYSTEEAKGFSISRLIPFNQPDEITANLGKIKREERLPHYKTVHMRKDRALIYVSVTLSPIKNKKGEIIGASMIARDISEGQKTEVALEYFTRHDLLTGLYNRVYFEEVMCRLESSQKNSVGLIICDVNGLKIVNDTLGHSIGDHLLKSAAGILKKCFRKEDVVARVGGDEFAIMLLNASASVLEAICRRIRECIEAYNKTGPQVPLNMCFGTAVKDMTSTSIKDLFTEADNNMRREKLHCKSSSSSGIVKILMKALEARDFITEGHVDRLQELVLKMSPYSDSRAKDLQLFAQFHDIGKVGIPDRILFKSGPLTPEEALEMQKHCEIGFRIAMSSPDLAPIADWILKHHEWWNGKGYPLGLKGEDIPVECRILAIADAYDAMTNDRPYRKALSHLEAVEELKRYAGIQFDPHLVFKFLKPIR
ncbi:MAG: diguanylate cyclase [Dethiobacter sp.]|jgi:diguanylate cyclase (GGDEF)-like protein/PAS domain S-box-containing protein|nr:MAG: diguanylate cyclase [Dethiobacter sp.]